MKNKCPFCDEIIPDDEEFCPKCKHEIEQDNNEQDEEILDDDIFDLDFFDSFFPDLDDDDIYINRTNFAAPEHRVGPGAKILIISAIALACLYVYNNYSQVLDFFSYSFDSSQTKEDVSNQYNQNASAKDNNDLTLGQEATFTNGSRIVIKSAEKIYIPELDESYVVAKVLVENNGDKALEFKPYHFTSFDSSGREKLLKYGPIDYAEKGLETTSLAPGESIEGCLYFDPESQKIYYVDLLSRDANATWVF